VRAAANLSPLSFGTTHFGGGGGGGFGEEIVTDAGAEAGPRFPVLSAARTV
jgi:hypothetical protein